MQWFCDCSKNKIQFEIAKEKSVPAYLFSLRDNYSDITLHKVVFIFDKHNYKSKLCTINMIL